MAEYYPEAIRDILGDSGTFTGGPAKGVLHTTEGKNYAGARSAYVANKSNPHFTVSFEKGYFQCWQHCSIARASRALKNLSGGVQTNRDMAIQIEIVGSCNPPNSNWGNLYVPTFPNAYKDGIGRLMRWIEANAGVKRFADATFKAYPGSYGNNGVRFSGTKWENYSGWCGHQHVPENTHGDPGNIDIAYLLNVGVSGPVANEPGPTVGTTVKVADDLTVNETYLELSFDSNGNGWVQIAVDPAKIVSVKFHGSYPPVDGYWAIPDWACQDRGGQSVLTFRNGPANGTLMAWVYSRP